LSAFSIFTVPVKIGEAILLFKSILACKVVSALILAVSSLVKLVVNVASPAILAVSSLVKLVVNVASPAILAVSSIS
jgi:hypothetical protein